MNKNKKFREQLYIVLLIFTISISILSILLIDLLPEALRKTILIYEQF